MSTYGSLPLVKSILRDAATKTGLEIFQIRSAKSKNHYAITVDMVTNPDYSEFTKQNMRVRDSTKDHSGYVDDLYGLFNQMIMEANRQLRNQKLIMSVYVKHNPTAYQPDLQIKARADT